MRTLTDRFEAVLPGRWLAVTRPMTAAPVLLMATGLSVLAPQMALAQDEAAVAGARRVLATSALAAKEYAEGVVGGMIVLEEEVVEALLFLQEARTSATALPASVVEAVVPLVDSMIATVEATGDPAILAGLSERMTTILNDAFGGIEEAPPSHRFSTAEGERVYAQACASCHGDGGRGDGLAAIGLRPPPSDFTDAVNLADQTPQDFYRKIGIGVAGTAMLSFENTLSDAERWAVAWYVTQFRASRERVAEGGAIVSRHCGECDTSRAGTTIAVLPAELADPAVSARVADEDLVALLRDGALGDGISLDDDEARSVVAYLRTLPFAEADVAGDAGVFAGVRTELARALRLATDGDADAAATKTFDAYVRFEEVETEVGFRDAGLVGELEAEFGAFRGRIARGDDGAALGHALAILLGRLDEAEGLVLGERTSTAGVFAQSFILLLREGIEALLIVGALVTLVVRAGAKHRQREIWWGVGVGVVASLITAVLLETVFTLGVAQQEALEGITMLVATAVLIFVSYWLISKVEARRWQMFVQSQVDRALTSGSMFTLGLAAFLAVYREGFETVLFYKALVISSDGSGAAAILGGGVLGAGALVAIYWGIKSFGLRIPLRPFFALTSAVLLYMAFSFAGKGIAELQESQLVSITLLDWVPRLPWAGIYPTAQSLALQGMVLLLVGGGLLWTFVLQPRFARA